MTTHTATPSSQATESNPEGPVLDEQRVEQFVGQVLTDFAGAGTAAMIAIGDRLGLYESLTGAGALTAAQLAARTGTNERLVTEWLASQTVSGYVVYDSVARTYEFPTEHAAVLSIVDSPAYIIGAVDIIADEFYGLERLERAFRSDGAIDYGDHHPRMYHGIERFFRTAYVNELAATWFPAVDGLVERLESGARVADVGCGHGASTIIMGSTWAASSFVGFDIHPPSIAVARAKAVEAVGVDNVTFHVAAADEVGQGPFDALIFFDALHDMGDPLGALRRAYEVLADDGIVVAVEPWSADRLEDEIGLPVARIDYAASTALCTPCSLSQPGAFGLGTQGGPTKRLELLAAAGFRDAVVAADTGFNLVLAARK